jgi:predicted GIY-YIG superfamily endonuclease
MEIEELTYTNPIPGVYEIYHIKSGKVYVGSTINLYNRIKAHESNLRKNKHANAPLQKAYNDDARIKFHLYLCNNAYEAYHLEQERIRHHQKEDQCFNLRSPNNELSEELADLLKDQPIQKARPVSINGKVYSSAKVAARELRVSTSVVSTRLSSLSDSFIDWFYL